MLGVDRDQAAAPPAEAAARVIVRTVVHAQHDDASDLRPKMAGRSAAIDLVRHPGHRAVAAAGEPRPQSLAGNGIEIGRGDPARVKPELAGLGPQLFDQKSRSA